ncbi:MAG TPA: hypothetical protein VF280_09995 [Burkholderiales bacterium]
MAELDRVREQIAYLKFWQGIMVVTDISLVGWLITAADDATFALYAMALGTVAALSLGIMKLHRRIELRIEATARL